MALRKIRKSGDPILGKKSKPINCVDDKILSILDDMEDTLESIPNGGGLAACQVGILKRLIVIDLGDGVLKLINPEIIESSGEQFEMEGCLSFPDVWGKVRRPEEVVVKALNEKGEEIILKGDGIKAVCFCHEIDHLDGKVFVDQIEEFEQFEQFEQ